LDTCLHTWAGFDDAAAMAAALKETKAMAAETQLVRTRNFLCTVLERV
jgi:hypothetical protein